MHLLYVYIRLCSNAAGGITALLLGHFLKDEAIVQDMRFTEDALCQFANANDFGINRVQFLYICIGQFLTSILISLLLYWHGYKYWHSSVKLQYVF